MEGDGKMKKRIFVITILVGILLAGSIPLSNSQIILNNEQFSLELVLAPSQIGSDFNENAHGYVFLLNADGVPIKPSQNILIDLKSDDTSIASVPSSVTFKQNESFAQFEIIQEGEDGEVIISAEFGSDATYKPLLVGSGKDRLPDDTVLELHFPTNEMHVNTEMPFTVYLKSSDGNIIRAPYDIQINLDYEKDLANPNQDTLVINKGEYYAWGTIKTHEKTGNTFLRASEKETGLDTAKDIEISSSLPTQISIDIYPRLIPASGTRDIGIFVSLLDSDGNPAITPKDVPLEFFSDQQEYVQDQLDDAMKERKLMIKKGEFGLHLSQELGLHLLRSRSSESFVANDILIGVNAKGLGTAVDRFTTVGESLNVDDEKVKNTDIELFAVDKIPSKATAVIGYQMKAFEDDKDDPEDVEECTLEDIGIDEDKEKTQAERVENREDCVILNIDMLADDEQYPVQSSDYYATQTGMLATVISGDQSLVNVVDHGILEPASSFGSALISSGDRTGRTTISVSINGVGSASKEIDVINPLQQEEITIFSPVGHDIVLFDRQGHFDLFLVAIDNKNRAKILDKDSKYLVTPTNQPIEIENGKTFSFAQLRSDSFKVEEGHKISLTAKPIGEDVDAAIQTSKTFSSQPSSKLSIILPTEKFNIENEQHIGIVQLVDMQDNPIKASKSIKTKISSSNDEIAFVSTSPEISAGKSFTVFSIDIPGKLDEASVFASAKGIVGDSAALKTSSSMTKLKIFASGLGKDFSSEKPNTVKLFVDDEKAKTVSGASLKIEPDSNVTVTPTTVKTASDGSATVEVTATGGPKISFSVFATAEGYEPGKETFVVNVDAPQEQTMTDIDLQIPEWIIYAAVGGVAIIGGLVFLFIRKSGVPLDEEYEEEEI